MKLLLLGAGGMLGHALARELADYDMVVGDLPDFDLTDFKNLNEKIRQIKPEVLINCAAYTDVDGCEQNAEAAERVNGEALSNLAKICSELDVILVHYSTDYVFDGSGTAPRDEQAPVAPLSVYGQTKLEGEQAIQASGCRHLIFRTSWVYAARGGNFAKTMLRLAQERERLTVINDQWGAPTGADLLADVTAHAIHHVQRHPQEQGLYHCVAGGATTWHAYASEVIDQARQLRPDLHWPVREVAPVPTSAFPTPARRPANSRLSSDKLQRTMGLYLPPWQQGVARMLREIL